jgi:hypothetical protein
MKTLCMATVFALLAGSAVQAGSIIDTLIKESGVKIDDKSITMGDQKFNRSDVNSILNGLDKLMKDAIKDRADEMNKSLEKLMKDAMKPSQRDDAASSRTNDHAAPRFEDAFWCEEIGTYAIALDGDKQPCRAASSNAGQVARQLTDNKPSVSTPAKDNALRTSGRRSR